MFYKLNHLAAPIMTLDRHPVARPARETYTRYGRCVRRRGLTWSPDVLAIKSNSRRTGVDLPVSLMAIPVRGGVLPDTRGSSRPPGKEKLYSFNADVLQAYLSFWF